VWLLVVQLLILVDSSLRQYIVGGFEGGVVASVDRFLAAELVAIEMLLAKGCMLASSISS
jgi:hypothetical protein